MLNLESIDISELPNSSEEALLEFDKKLRKILTDAQRYDQEEHVDRDGIYTGDYLPERGYVCSILAFLDEYNIDVDVSDISELSNSDFPAQFTQFLNKVHYALTRFYLRKHRIKAGLEGTIIMITSSYREEIGKLLNTIRKIVNQEVRDENKKDLIFRKISSLQREVDRDRTTVDALFSRLLEFSQIVGQCAENIEPLVEKMERLKKVFFEGVEKEKTLPRSHRPKLISPTPEEPQLDDEIPF